VRREASMTEAEWLACDNPSETLDFLRGKASDRKLRLFAVACCRRVWHMHTNDAIPHAVEVSERFAEGTAGSLERREAALATRQLLERHGDCNTASYFATNAAAVCTGLPAQRAASAACVKVQNAVSFAANLPVGCPDPWKPRREEEEVHSAFVRCIFGNPFRPVTLNVAWQTPTILALAAAAYENRIMPAGTLEPDRLAVLADALEETGCDSADIINHLRSPGPHVRGCWVVDLLLGKV
jgi:hypothetical protein